VLIFDTYDTPENTSVIFSTPLAAEKVRERATHRWIGASELHKRYYLRRSSKANHRPRSTLSEGSFKETGLIAEIAIVVRKRPQVVPIQTRIDIRRTAVPKVDAGQSCERRWHLDDLIKRPLDQKVAILFCQKSGETGANSGKNTENRGPEFTMRV
jgi:hypothetical protein